MRGFAPSFTSLFTLKFTFRSRFARFEFDQSFGVISVDLGFIYLLMVILGSLFDFYRRLFDFIPAYF